jgi:hypothetical protein
MYATAGMSARDAQEEGFTARREHHAGCRSSGTFRGWKIGRGHLSSEASSQLYARLKASPNAHLHEAGGGTGAAPLPPARPLHGGEADREDLLTAAAPFTATGDSLFQARPRVQYRFREAV